MPPRWLRPLVLVLCAIPALVGIAGVLSDIFLGTRWFGSNPIEEVEHFSGKWTLAFLGITLAVTPVRRLTGWNWLQRYRRGFGLWAFAYACLHLLVYFVLDVELGWSELVEDVMKRKYITIGMTAFVLLIPLAITSTRGWVRRLGKRWTTLHRLIYVIPVLGLIHFWMAVKKDVTDPILFTIPIVALLAWRVPALRRLLAPGAPAAPAAAPSAAPMAAPATVREGTHRARRRPTHDARGGDA